VKPLVLAIVISSIGLFAAAAQAQQKAAQTEEPQNRSYVPDLGDIMETTQLRHFKLYFAGHLGNWRLTRYELSQIRKSFDEAAKLYPDIANVALEKLIAETSGPALMQVSDAIKTEDGAAFSRAFGKLTEACNSCHQAAGFGFIFIRVPTSSPFSNESFAPKQD
jgi:hypothetical protein